MTRGRLLRPQCRVVRNEAEASYTVAISIPEAWLDLEGPEFHEKMDDALGAMMRVFEAGRTERAEERRRGG